MQLANPSFTCSDGSPVCTNCSWSCASGTECTLPPRPNLCGGNTSRVVECGGAGWYCWSGTSPTLPYYVCAAEDGTIWSFGTDRDSEGKSVEDSLLLRQYSFETGQLGAMLDKSALNSSGWTLGRGRYPGEISLRCTSQKVGLLNGRSSEYVEFDIPTGKLKVSKINPLLPPKQMRITGFALTESGDVFVSLHDNSSGIGRSGIFHLTFDSSGVGSWTPLLNTVGPYLHGGPVDRLLGTDGTNLVYTRDLSGKAYWSKFTK
jgi:hypothetical protein